MCGFDDKAFLKYMRTATLLLLAIGLAMQVQAQSYEPTDTGSKVKFSIKNFSINTTGTFTGLKGAIVFDPANPAKSTFEVSVDANTVNTGTESRDNHLRKEDYFNVSAYPRISFKSDKITAQGNGFTMNGKLTMKGVTKDVSFPFSAVAKDKGYLFEGTLQLNRKDYKVGGNSFVLGDNVTVDLSVYAAKK
jgi:polyisoprenoid-binding protein YceI